MPAPIPGVRYTRPPGAADWFAPGRAPLDGLPSTGASTFDVFPNLDSHPGAVWTRSGNTLTSPGRLPLPVYDIADGFILGETRPTWSNSGCRKPLAQLTTYVGTTANQHELVTTADGQVIENLYMPDSRIRVRHKNVTIRNCVIRIGYDANRPYIQNNCAVVADVLGADTRNLRIEYVTVDPLNAGDGGAADGYNVSGFFLDNGVVWRCAIRNVTDGVMPDVHPLSGGLPIHVWGNYIATRWLPDDPGQTDGTHNDGVQIAGGSGHTMIGNAIVNPTGGVADPATGMIVRGQCIVLTPYHATADTGWPYGTRDASLSSTITIEKNWLSGGYTQVAAWTPYGEGGPGVPNLRVVGNRHGGQCVWPILLTPFANISKRAISGNVADSTGLRWNQAGGVAGSSTIASTGTVNPSVANPANSPGPESHPNSAFAGSDQVAEPGLPFYLAAKGKGSNNVWVKTGAWSIVSSTGEPPAITSDVGSDGATWAWFVPAKSPSTQTVVLRWTPTGVSASDTVTITIPPWQTGA